jgi:hypothetical protein
MYEEETQILIQINMKRINIETQRIIIALEATALEFRLREEARIWAEINILIKTIGVTADRWLVDETARINADIQIQITVIVNDGQAGIAAALAEWKLRVEQEIAMIKVNARVQIDAKATSLHIWVVA